LTGAGNCITGAWSLRNVYLTPCYQSLKHLKLHRMQIKSHSTWEGVIESISHFPALEICQPSSLNSLGLSADGLQKARFFEIIVFEVEGRELKSKLLDLVARLQVYGAAWRNEPLSSPTKWADDLSAKVGSRVKKQEEVTAITQATRTLGATPITEADHEVEMDTRTTVAQHSAAPSDLDNTTSHLSQLQLIPWTP
jgi:hypothetical protein